jgi:hypothetical protein
VGDTRPATIDDTAGYPTSIITKIFQGVQAMSPRPSFVIGTGDYAYATATGSEAAAQMALYMKARANYTGLLYAAMGNHECTGFTASNCGSGSAYGITNNYSEYLSQFLKPIQQTAPNFVIHVNASDGSWTAKFVFVPGNAWSSGTATWLENALSEATTYTFIVRHEPKAASTAPGCTPSETIMAKHPYTLAIVGHTHTYERVGQQELIVGNGGAPISGGKDYGFAVLQMRADKAIQVDMINYATGAADTSFRFAVKADGSSAP